MSHTKPSIQIVTSLIVFLISMMILSVQLAGAAWEPPTRISREEIVKASKSVLGVPDIKMKKNEDIFRIQVVGLEWDMGVMVYEPADASKIPVGPDGKKIGMLLLHGGSGDYRSMEKLAILLATKFGYKIVSMTYPGRLYLQSPDRNWPGDTIHPDGTVRTPIWKKDELITRDQYEVLKDTSMRMRYGTRVVAKAKPGTTFYYRMAGWPIAFEEGMKEACKRHFPVGEYSIYPNGHSTGGPIIHMLLQRVSNIAGLADVEGSPFGYIGEKTYAWGGSLGQIGDYGRVTDEDATRTDPFDELYIRTWRDKARYQGPEALGQEGPKALMRLPMLMEEVFEEWDKTVMQPNFKAEYLITHNIVKSLTEGAQVTAKRLNMGPKETEALIKRYLSYPRELSGPGVNPVPPLLYNIAKDSRDHSPQVYKEIIIPMCAAMNPAPKVRVVQYDAGVHTYSKAEKDLPMGIVPAVAKLWYDAIMGGFFLK